MGEKIEPGAPMSDRMYRRLTELRRALIRLHKILMEDQRIAYERIHGQQVHGFELLELVMNHESFNWLHPISQFIVRVDEFLESEEELTQDAALQLTVQARKLFVPAEDGTSFQKSYFIALQREPAAVLAHGEVMRVLTTNGES